MGAREDLFVGAETCVWDWGVVEPGLGEKRGVRVTVLNPYAVAI